MTVGRGVRQPVISRLWKILLFSSSLIKSLPSCKGAEEAELAKHPPPPPHPVLAVATATPRVPRGHTKVISTSSIFSICLRCGCVGGGGAART